MVSHMRMGGRANPWLWCGQKMVLLSGNACRWGGAYILMPLFGKGGNSCLKRLKIQSLWEGATPCFRTATTGVSTILVAIERAFNSWRKQKGVAFVVVHEAPAQRV